MRSRLAVSVACASLGFAAACALHSAPSVDLALLYTPAARHHGPDRNPIIAIPGILGSKLEDQATGRIAWGAFEPGAADPARPEDARLIALPISERKPLAELHDQVVPTGVLDRVRIVLAGIALDIQAYAGILATLGVGGYRDESLGLAGEVDYGDDHYTCFQFAYDWRRDNVENARRLHEFILEKRKYIQEQYRSRYGIENAQVKFDIAAHSMGGLVARYFLMYGGHDLPSDGGLPELTWEGASLVERVILVGTPNAGSANALLELVNGRKIGPLLPYYAPALMGTFPAVYELLPRSRHRSVVWDGDASRPVEDLYDPALWQRMGWGLAAPAESEVLAELLPGVNDPAERRRMALAYQARALRRAQGFAAALDRPAPLPAGLDLFLVAGDAIPTVEGVAVDSKDGSLRVVSRTPGDGTVTRASALLDERAGATWQPRVASPLPFTRVLFLPDDHLALTRNEVFRDNVLYWLLEEPRSDVAH